MLQEILTYGCDIATHFSGINWAELNKKHIRNYANATDEIFSTLEQGDVDIEAIKEEVSIVYTTLGNL